MKKLFVSGLIALAAPALLVSPAGAAVPTTKAKQSAPCPDGHGSARLWATVTKKGMTKLAADNPCTQAVRVAAMGYNENGTVDTEWYLAPGAHFNWGKARIAEFGITYASPGLGRFTDEVTCNGPTGRWEIFKYNEVRMDEGSC